MTLLVLFLSQLFAAEWRIYFAPVYATLGLLVLVRDRRTLLALVRARG